MYSLLSLYAGGIRLWRFAGLPTRRALKRLDCARLIEVKQGVELLRQARVKVMALALCIRAVNDAYRSLKARPAQDFRRNVFAA